MIAPSANANAVVVTKLLSAEVRTQSLSTAARYVCPKSWYQVSLTKSEGSFTLRTMPEILNPYPTQTSTIRPTPLVLIGSLVMRPLLILALGILTPLVVRLANPNASWQEAAAYENATVILVDVITIGVVAMLLARQSRRIGDLLNFRPADIGWGLLVALILLAGFFVCTFIGNLIVYRGPPPIPEEIIRVPLVVGLVAMIAPLTIAVAEELLYRGWLQPHFEARLGHWPGMLLVALAFGVQHIGFALGSPAAMASKVIATALVGVLFGVLYWWRKRLMPLVVGHAVLDLLGLGIPTLVTALS